MRTPNCSCVICSKPLYRRPAELAHVRHVACMEHRGVAQAQSGVTVAQQAALALGRPKGTNHRVGYRHSAETKAKTAAANKAFWSANSGKAIERGAKTRGERNVRWKGGSSRLNTSIRQMTENRRWMDAIKERDGACQKCGSPDNLESHHSPSLADLIERFGIRSRDDAREHAAVLWDLSGGIALCQRCHYAEHGRMLRAA